MSKIKLTGGYENVDIDYIDLTRTSAGTVGPGSDADIAAAYLYEGSTLLATGVLTSNSVYRFDLTNYTLNAYASKVLTVKADFNGRLTGATSRHQNAFDLADVGDLSGTGLASGNAVDASAPVITQPDTYIFRSIPTFEVCAIGTTGCVTPAATSYSLSSSNDQEIIRIKITADSAGDVVLDHSSTTADNNFIRLTLSGYCTNDAVSTTENFVLKNITDNQTIQTVTTDVCGKVLGTNGNEVDFNSFSTSYPLQIGAGQSKIITVEADLGDFNGGGETIKATIGATGTDLGWSDVDTANVTDANANFIWLPLQGPSITKPAT